MALTLQTIKNRSTFIQILNNGNFIKGEFINFDSGEDTDEWALKNNYVSVVPVQFDLTAYNYIKKVNEIMK